VDKDFYNKSSSDSLGWNTSWFGCEEFDNKLVKAVQKWQKSMGLKADGLVGPMTYRRIWTEREVNISDYAPSRPRNSYNDDDKYIVHNGHFIPIEWDNVILWNEDDGLKSNKGCYTDLSGKEDRKPTMFVNHWDVCLSAESCEKVLNRRGVSVHFCIVHGRTLDPFLDFYPVQLEALKTLWKAIHIGIGIPLNYPKNSAGQLDFGLCTGVYDECVKGKFHGFCNHYNFTKGKIDCAGLDLPKLLHQVKNTPMYCLDRN
jgi:hypothetical protein